MELGTLVPIFGAADSGPTHGWWWVILAVVVFALVVPLAYSLGRNGGQPQRR